MRTLCQIIILFILCFAVTSCDWIKQNYTTQPDSKVFLSQLEYTSNNGIKLIYKDNVLFTGEAWSSDGKAFCIICQNGRLLELQGKNQNQTNALVINLRPGQEFGNGGILDTFDQVYYLNDGNGNQIMRLGRVPNGFRHECYGGTIETITNHDYIKDAFRSHANLLQSYEAILDIELKKKQ